MYFHYNAIRQDISKEWTKDFYIYIYRYHRLVVPSGRIFLTLLATPLYRSSLPAGPQWYTRYPHGADIYRFELVALLLFGHVKGSIGIHHL